MVEIFGRPQSDVFHIDRLIPPEIDLNLKLMPSTDNFVCKSAAPVGQAVQENYKMEIIRVTLTIRTKQLSSTAPDAHNQLLITQNMRSHYSRVQEKHLSIPANTTLTKFDYVFTGAIPDLVIVGLLSDADFAGGYQRNPFNFQNFGMNRKELKPNGTSVPQNGYTPNFAN